jgi:hypothetical protein
MKKPKGGKGGGRKARSTPSKKERIAIAIASCRNSRGRIDNRAVLAAARNPTHPHYNVLNPEFEWDKDKLVEQALLARASELIRECRSIIQYGEREILIPTYVSEPRAPKPTYIPTMLIAKNAGHKKLVLEAEVNRIKAAVQRAVGLAIVFNLQEKFEKMLQDIMDIEVELDKE